MDKPSVNMNREIWRQEMHDTMDVGNYYAPNVFVVGDSAIGIDVGGQVNVRDVREWAAMPAELARLRAELEQATANKPFDARDELQQLRTSNHYMAEELTRLRADHAIEFRDLSEARADVARFEAALDAANRALAEARCERDFAQEGEENLRHLKKMWEQECGYYVGLWREKSHECSRHRSTIRALVVAARGMYYAILRALVGWGVPPSDKLAKQATTRIKYGIMRTREAEKE